MRYLLRPLLEEEEEESAKHCNDPPLKPFSENNDLDVVTVLVVISDALTLSLSFVFAQVFKRYLCGNSSLLEKKKKKTKKTTTMESPGGQQKLRNTKDFLRKFDVFPKFVDVDFYLRSFGGGIITVVTYIVAVSLLLAETKLYLKTHVKHDLYVDNGRGETMRINVDVFFPNLSCGSLGLDVMDVSGETHLDVVDHEMRKIRYDRYGVKLADALNDEQGKEEVVNEKAFDSNETETASSLRKNKTKKTAKELIPRYMEDGKTKYCGSCYGADVSGANRGREQRCCQTCEEVREAYIEVGWAFTGASSMEQCKREGFSEVLGNVHEEGCEFKGFLDVNKVQGNFHIAPGKSFQQGEQHVHDLSPFPDGKFNFSHEVRHLSFGEGYPGKVDPLDGTKRTLKLPAETGVYQYFFRIVPTTYTYLNPFKKDISTNQYSVVDHFKPVDAASIQGGSSDLPGVFFFYDLSPIKVDIAEYRTSVWKFLAEVCASVGGVFAVSGIVDKVVYKGSLAIKKKIQLGVQD